MIKTHVTFAAGVPTEEQQTEAKNKAAEMATEGKTDDVYIVIKNPEIPNQYTVERTWTDTAAANEWISYIQTFGPISAEIVD